MKKLERIQKVKGKRFLFKVETSKKPEDYKKYEELRLEVWGDPSDNFPGKRNLEKEIWSVKISLVWVIVFLLLFTWRMKRGD